MTAPQEAMTAPQEVASDNTSVLPVARRDTSVSPLACLSTNQQLIRRLTFTKAPEQLTFTTAPEQQVEHYEAENNNTSNSTVARRPHTAPTPAHGKCRTNANCLTALEMSQLGDGCSLQYQGY